MEASGPEAWSDNPPSVPQLVLIVSLLLAGVICGVIVGLAYVSLFLFALLEAVGIPATAGLAAILLIKTEQSMVGSVTGWRPAALPLILAALPATSVAFGLRLLLQWNGWFGVAVVIAAALVIQGLVLHYLIAAGAQKASAPLD
jgi:hypothetical protein